MAFLEQLTRVETPSVAPETQDRARSVIADRLRANGFRTLKLTGKNHGGNLLARPQNRTRTRPFQLLVGHYDTVWPLGTLKDMPFEVDGNVVRGPGVYDMKGGITQIIFALEALSHFGCEPERDAGDLRQFRRRDRQPRVHASYPSSGAARLPRLRAGALAGPRRQAEDGAQRALVGSP